MAQRVKVDFRADEMGISDTNSVQHHRPNPTGRAKRLRILGEPGKRPVKKPASRERSSMTLAGPR